MASRFTFREAAGDVAWQRQLRDQHLSEGTPPVPHLDVARSLILPVSRRMAEQIILKYEWLGTMAQTRHHFGIFFGAYCAGVTCVGSNCTGGAMSHRQFGIESRDLLVLARGACVHWAPTGANSRLIAWTCRLLQRDRLGKVLIAYSDTDAGEIGTVYQACNWVCIGRGSVTRQWIAPNGRVYDQMKPRDLSRDRGGQRLGWVAALKRAGWREQQSNPKHRYVYLLDRSDRALAERIERLRQPYPKRERSADGGAAGVQSAGGGSTPTRSLAGL